MKTASDKFARVFVTLCIIMVYGCNKDTITLEMAENYTRSDITIEDMEFRRGDTIFACGGVRYAKGEILMTCDGGISWNTVFECEEKLYDMSFYGDYYALAVGDSTRIQRSDNGGMDWTTKVNTDYFWTNDLASLRKVGFLDGSNILAVGGHRSERGNSYYSWDCGMLWSNTHGYNALEDMWVFDGDSTYACGYGIVQKITEGGRKVEILPFSGDIFTGIWFTSSSVGYLCGYDGGIYKTKDGGACWETVYMKNKVVHKRRRFTDILFSDIANGYAVGESGLMVITKDGGTSWNEVKTKNKADYTGLQYHNGLLYVYSKNGVYYTMDVQK